MFPPKKIICPTDFSEASLEALANAVELATHFSADVYLVHVLPGIPIPSDAFVADLSGSQEEWQAEAEARMRKLAEPLNAQGLRTQIIVAHGDPAEEIVRVAQEENADRIVIATHGMTGWRHLAFGSVTEKVVRLATCPVLTIRSAPAMAKDRAA